MVSTKSCVPARSSSADNVRIRRQLDANVAYFSDHRDQIADRLQELDEEWDIERAIEAMHLCSDLRMSLLRRSRSAVAASSRHRDRLAVSTRDPRLMSDCSGFAQAGVSNVL